jgi:hypothetical protein
MAGSVAFAALELPVPKCIGTCSRSSRDNNRRPKVVEIVRPLRDNDGANLFAFHNPSFCEPNFSRNLVVVLMSLVSG